MRFFRRIAGILGFGKDEQHQHHEDEVADNHHNLNQNQHHDQQQQQQQHHHHQNQQNRDSSNSNNSSSREETRRSSKGFGVKAPVVVVDRVNPGPLLVPTDLDDGGVQGLKWYAKRLRIDEDGDVADEFFDEVVQPLEVSSAVDDRRQVSSAADDRRQVSSAADDRRQLLKKFELKYSTKPAKVRKQEITIDGKIRQSVEYQGKIQWV